MNAGLAGLKTRASMQSRAAGCTNNRWKHMRMLAEISAFLEATKGMSFVLTQASELPAAVAPTSLFKTAREGHSRRLHGNRTAGAGGRTRPPAFPAAAALPGPGQALAPD